MKYLLDVNVLIALLVHGHEHHEPARAWLDTLRPTDTLALTPLVELGFLRVGLQARYLGDLASGQQILASFMRGTPKVGFIADDSRAASLPEWAQTAARLTDGHLLALAEANDAELVTFDTGIPGARLIQ